MKKRKGCEAKKEVEDEHRNNPKRIKGMEKEKNKDNVDERGFRKFKTHCRPIGLVTLIKDFSEVQREAVKSIGFGALLELKLKAIPTSMLRWLVQNFNGKSQMLSISENRSFAITADDVHDIFQLPREEGSDGLGCDDAVISLFKSDLKQKYNVDSSSTLSNLKGIIKDLKDGGDDFKRLFVLYSLGSFLVPSANLQIDFGALKFVAAASNISKFNWCSHILKKLCEAVNRFKDGRCKTNLGGCVLILQLCYFHRLKWKGVAEKSDLPLIQHWTDEKLRGRMNDEKNAGVFGQGIWSDIYPISSHKEVPLKEDKKTELQSSDEAEESSQDVPEPKRFIKQELPDGELDDSEIHKIAKDEIYEAFLLMKRDMAVVSHVHMKRMTKLKKKFEKKEAPSSSTQSPDPSESQRFFADDKVQKCIDDLVENFLRMNKFADGIDVPSFELLSPETSKRVDALEEDNNDGVPPNNDPDVEISEAIASIGPKQKRKPVEDEQFSCYSWNVAVEAGYKSRFMKLFENLLVGMSTKEKHAVDYCFLEDTSRDKLGNVFSARGICYIPKQDIETLNYTKLIATNVIDAWSMFLNRTKEKEHQPRCFYFNIAHTLYLTRIVKQSYGDLLENQESIRSCWKIWMEHMKEDLSIVEMIFVPIHLHDHYCAVVINMPDERIQFLDNRNPKDLGSYLKAAETVHQQMSIFLEDVDHPKARDISRYSFEVVPFPWKSNRTNIDCGVFLMHHMQNFKGKVYTTPDLSKVMIRRALRAKICITLVMVDFNTARNDLIDRVKDFCVRKRTQKMK